MRDDLDDLAELLTAAERRALRDLVARARRAGMSLWAYAVHSGRAEALRVTVVYRAMTDMAFSTTILRRGVRGLWVDLGLR